MVAAPLSCGMVIHVGYKPPATLFPDKGACKRTALCLGNQAMFYLLRTNFPEPWNSDRRRFGPGKPIDYAHSRTLARGLYLVPGTKGALLEVYGTPLAVLGTWIQIGNTSQCTWHLIVYPRRAISWFAIL